MTKYCPSCKKDVPLDGFSKGKKGRFGKYYICKNCVNNRHKIESKYFAHKLYYEQRGSSKQRGHPMPDYTKEEFVDWLLSQEVFHDLYKEWQDSGFIWGLMPSGDRLDDDKPYTLDNLQIVTWDFNRSKSQISKRKPVNCFTKSGVFVKSFESINHAAAFVSGNAGSIKEVCDGFPTKCGKKKSGGYYYRTRKIANGYQWKYKTK